MSMNRFGIRLAAGLAVITIGCLGIFQAQRGSETVVEEPWDDAEAAAAKEPPTPLQLENGAPAPLGLTADDPALLVRGNDSAAGGDVAASGPSSDFGFGAFDSPVDSSADGPASGVAPAVGGELVAMTTDPAAAGPAGDIRLAAHDEPAAGPASGFAFPQPPTSASADSDAEAGTESPSFAFAPAAGEAASPDQVAPAEAPVDEAAPPASMPPTGSSSVTISAIDEAPVGSSLQMPQPLSTAPESEQAAPPQELAEQQAPQLEPLDPQPTTADSAALQPLEPSADGLGASAAEPAAMASSAFELGPGPSAGGQPVGGGTNQTAQPQDDFAAASTAAAAPELSANTAADTDGPQAFGAPLRASPLAAASQPAPMSQPMTTQAASPSMQTVDPNEVLAEPGERRLEGAQTPSVVIHKRAPEEVRVGKPADFIIQVKNVGTVAALDVRVFDSVPQGMQLVEVVPQAAEIDGLLCWQLGDLEPGGERTVTVKLIPEVEGELGSVARVTFEAAASVRTIATRPQLKLVQRAPEQVLIGQQVEIEVELSNVGSGTAAGVMLQADLAEGLQHPMGRQLDNLIGAMPPGDVRRQILRLRATAAGKVQNTIRLMGEDGVTAESTVEIEVIAPALEVALSGPSLRYLERQTTYNVQVANSGTANASEVDIVAYLDRGLKFVSTEFEGQYDPNRHAVFWSLAELPAGQSGEVPLTLLPVEAGMHNVRLEAKADLGVSAASEKELAIETLAELSFSIADDQDPIETNAETTYEIRVQNTGSRDDASVQLKVQLPPGMELISADPQAGTDGRGLVVFQPIARIEAKGEQIFRVRVRGKSADTHLIQAILTSEQSPKPVTKEESTTVYSDR